MDENWIMMDNFKLVIGEINLHNLSYEMFNFYIYNYKIFINIFWWVNACHVAHKKHAPT
jgi:hypothetical protein